MTDLARAVRFQSAMHFAGFAQAKHAIVSSVDPANHAVKLTLQPEGAVTGWIPDPGLACGGLRIACPSEVGTQVLAVPVEGDAEHPVVVARLFDTTNVPPLSPATGRAVQPGEIGIFLAGGDYLHLSTSGIYLKGDLLVTGSVKASGDVAAGSISLLGHVHGGVASGIGQTSAPVQAL